MARVFVGDRAAARSFTERILLPILDAAVSRMLLGPRGQRFEKTDVIQEVFQHLYQDDWRWLRTYDAAKGSLANYIWAIARSWLRDHARRLPPPQPSEDLEREVSPDSGPERRAALGELMGRVHQGLTEEELALFQWIYLEGASHAVAAARLEITVDAGHKRVQRLEAKIRDLLSDGAPKETEKGRTP
jgi:RNA polymerase sigma factor (sigma-70 family)